VWRKNSTGLLDNLDPQALASTKLQNLYQHYFLSQEISRSTSKLNNDVTMTRISISDLKDQDSLSFLKDEKSNLISSAVDRALDARKIPGGAVGAILPPPRIGLIYVDPNVSGM
jgi:hypothetical protein